MISAGTWKDDQWPDNWTAVTVDGLESRTTYRLLVRAFNKAGSGANSTVITCYTVTIPG